MNILRFQPNIPTQVALQSSQGIVVEGRYGNRMMFSLVDGRVMYDPRLWPPRSRPKGLPPGSVSSCAKRKLETAAAGRLSGH